MRFKPLRKKRPLTLIVGIICKEEIILAAESQITFANSMRQDAEKIVSVECKNGTALVAQSGYTDLSCDAVDILRSRAKDLELKHHRDLPELAQKIAAELKTKWLVPYQNTGVSMREAQDYMRDNLDFHLMLAFYHDRKPFIYTLNFALGSITPLQDNAYHTTCGQGGTLGAYLLSEYAKQGMTAGFGTAIAIYVVETVKNHDSSCSGQTKVAVIRKPREHPRVRLPTEDAFMSAMMEELMAETVSILSKRKIEETAALIERVTRSTKQRQNKRLQNLLSKETEKRITKMLEEPEDYYQ